MRIYEIVLDGELTADLSDSVGQPVPRRQTAMERPSSAFPRRIPTTLAGSWRLLESLGIGVTAMQEVEDLPG